MDRAKQLGEGSVGKLLLKFSIPAIIGMLVNALYTVIDRIFVGQGVGLLGISATTIAFPISIIILGFGLLIGIGSAVSISIKLGQNNRKEAERILGNAFTLCIILSIFITVLGLAFQEPLLRIFGASDEVMPLAIQFLTIILSGTVLQLIGFALNNIMRAEGNPKMSMITMLIGAALNTILNPIFIFVLHLGIRGSALATVVSQLITSIWILAYFIKGKSLLKLKSENLKLIGNIVKPILAIGMSSFLFQVVSSIITVVFNQSLKTLGGDVAIASMGIITSIAMLIMMPIFGINQGVQPIIGYNYGAKNLDRVKRALKLAAIAATCISTTGFAIIELFPRQILSAFSSDNEQLLNIGAPGMQIFLMMLPIFGMQIVGANYFQAVGKARIAISLSLSKQVLFQLPLLLILPNFFKLTGIWAAGPVADVLSFVLVISFLIWELRNLQQTGDVSEHLLTES